MRISDWSSDVCSSDLIAQGVPGAEWFYDWAGGLIWLSLPPSADACAATVRGAVETHGGHATLIRADAATRAAVPVFEPQPPALLALTARVKAGFAPMNILNPGRLVAGVPGDADRLPPGAARRRSEALREGKRGVE